MQVLIVDDFQAIVESLEKGIDWAGMGIEKVYTATSAKVAKLLLMNFPIDLLICDIEMPEESGLELVEWARNHVENLEVVFLTSHAEFDYVMQAMHMGSFDYILQPVRFEDIIRVVEKIQTKIRKEKHYRQLERLSAHTGSQRNYILEHILKEEAAGHKNEADKSAQEYLAMNRYIFPDYVLYQAVIETVRWKKLIAQKQDYAFCEILRNAAEGFADENKVRLTFTPCGKDLYWLLLFADEGAMNDPQWDSFISEFYAFIAANMDFDIAVYYADQPTQGRMMDTFNALIRRQEQNTEHKSGKYSFLAEMVGRQKRHPAIDDALRYIEKNMNRNVSRAEVAGVINVSEEYFSRLFRQETGSTFKEYILDIKMKAAKDLLDNTGFSVGIVASKVGYSNFSYFSQQFRNYVGMTPQEYKKSKQG